FKGHSVRLSLIIHTLRVVAGEIHDGGIDAESVRRAKRLVQYFQAHAAKAHLELGADPKLKGALAALDWLRRTGATEFSKHELHKAIQGQALFKKADSLDAPLDLLVETGWIIRQPQPMNPGKGRRKGPCFWVHPSLTH